MILSLCVAYKERMDFNAGISNSYFKVRGCHTSEFG